MIKSVRSTRKSIFIWTALEGKKCKGFRKGEKGKKVSLKLGIVILPEEKTKNVSRRVHLSVEKYVWKIVQEICEMNWENFSNPKNN